MQALESEHKVIHLKQGFVEGKQVFLDNHEDGAAYVYYQIPYAAPPVGNLRFMPPQPASNWEGVRDGTNWGR